MLAKELEKKFIKFFIEKKHKEIPNAPLIPANDPTVLFTTAGMHPLVPFLLGQKHPLGKRLANVQKCLRTDDIDEVGDAFHLTFFEMLGNWSLGDYWKKEAIEWSYEFLTGKEWLGLDPKRIYVTVFAGDEDAPRDEESARIWRSLGIPRERIFYMPKHDNWWGPAGQTGPCGPDTEMFYDTGKEKCSGACKPGCSCGKYTEIWNDVFMQYDKKAATFLVDGMSCLYDENFNMNKKLLEIILEFPGEKILVVDGFREKAAAIVQPYGIQAFSQEGITKKASRDFFEKLFEEHGLTPDECVYVDHAKENIEGAQKAGIKKTLLFSEKWPIKDFLQRNSFYFKPLEQKNVDTGMGVERTAAVLQGKSTVFETELFFPMMQKIRSAAAQGNERSERIIADHMRAAVFVLAEGIAPSNAERGYVLRRLIRRSIRHAMQLNVKEKFMKELAEVVIENYKDEYKVLHEKKDFILGELEKEEEKFLKTLEAGMKHFNKITAQKIKTISGKDAFLLFQSYGFPLEMTQELAKENGIAVDVKGFQEEMKRHQELSRTATAGVFRSGLADSSETTTRLHTATHLLNEALRHAVDSGIKQRGSNITPERLRFDFNFSRKLTSEEIKKVENLVNEKIKEELPVRSEEMSLEKALASGAQAEFGAKYPERVSVYSVGSFSKEICTGPHVRNTREIGKFKIVKEEGVAAGVRRIKAVVE